MLDIQYIRENHKKVKQAASNKNISVDIDELLTLDQKRRELLQEIEKLRKARNETAAQMKNGIPAPELIAEGRRIKQTLTELETVLGPIDDSFMELLKQVPNMPLDYVPVGATEDDNVVEKTVGGKPQFDFKPKNHWEIAQAKGWLDKERAAKISGSRFAYLKGDLVLLQFAIVRYVMDQLSSEEVITKIVTDNKLSVPTSPFQPVIPPAAMKTEPYEATGRLKPKEITYKLTEDDLWLNGSAEHPIVAMYMNEILDEASLPIRYIGYSTSFRREAGTYGKDMEGMLRMHQFDKLEMESFTTGESGLEEHKFMIAVQEYFMQQLGLHYQILQKCTADIGDANAAGVDINTWLPGQDQYRETHSADYMTDFQARSLKTRVRRDSGDIELVHTNDATALVLSRAPIAIIENYQTKEGDVVIPEVLRPYMNNRTIM
jgi:seryl-tRNA synthetase